MEEIQNSIRPPRAGWADALRVLAMLSVVMLHCAVLPVGTETPGDTRFWVINLLDGGVRWGVPVFVMLSGAFLLDPKKEMNTRQWLSHVGRVALLTVFWGGVYALYAARGAHLGLEWLLRGSSLWSPAVSTTICGFCPCCWAFTSCSPFSARL